VLVNGFLRNLNLAGNSIESFDLNDVAGLSKLRNIYLRSNGLKGLSAERHPKVTLELLDLSNNEIKSVPIQLFDGLKGTRVDLRFNEIEDFTGYKGLDISISSYSIQTLDMSSNKIKVLPIEFFGKLSVKKLILGSNQISQFVDPYPGKTSIDTLDLTDNQITFVPFETFAVLNARNLILSGNQFQIDLGIFPRDVEILDLRNNDLVGIDLNNLIFYRNLKTVLLDGNKLSENFLDDRVGLSGMSGIKTFGVSGNEFYCGELIGLCQAAKKFDVSLTINGYPEVNNSTNINGIGCNWP
jgi:Leucine-rich repeat (LRR) protein